MLRLGLCCIFLQEPIKFRVITATRLQQIAATPKQRQVILSQLIQENLSSLYKAIAWCAEHCVGCFRIQSRLFPLYTHPQCGYALEDLPDAAFIFKSLAACRSLASKHKIRLTLHPDQFVVLNSPNKEVVKKSISELLYHLLIAEQVGADVINIHGGGVYGNKEEALQRLAANITHLPTALLRKLTLENDDKSYTPEDLLPLCYASDIPFVYDVHHHRCLNDTLSIADATELAMGTWNREPLMHISSPRNGWSKPHPERHHDYIAWGDFPKEWYDLPNITIEVEAKAKELAVLQLRDKINQLNAGTASVPHE